MRGLRCSASLRGDGRIEAAKALIGPKGYLAATPALRGIVADLINLAESQQEIIAQQLAIIAMNRRRGELNEQPVG